MASATAPKPTGLSTSTLSLRFMQNKSKIKTQLGQAEVKDDQEWQVSDAVQKAWRINGESRPSPQTVTYEPSYVPFLFENASASSSSSAFKPKGRRTFDSTGKEVELSTPAIFGPVDPFPIDDDIVEPESPESRGKKNAPKLYSISGSSSSTSRPKNANSALRKPIKIPSSETNSASNSKNAGPSARSLIHDMSAVGTDLRSGSRSSRVQYSDDGTPSIVSSSSKMAPPPPPPLPNKSMPIEVSKGFMKPAGVDPGLAMSKSKSKRPVEGDADVVGGAREKKKRKKEKGLVAPPAED